MGVSITLCTENCVTFSEIIAARADFDNSPTASLFHDLTNKDVLVLSRNGTRAISVLTECDRFFIGAFINLDAITKYLLDINPKAVSLIAIGQIRRNGRTPEDDFCADVIKRCLNGQNLDERLLRLNLAKWAAERCREANSPQGRHVEMDLILARALSAIDVVPEIVFSGETASVINANRKCNKHH